MTLHLSLKKEWYDMIDSGDKKEEYREIKPFWIKRLCDNISNDVNNLVISNKYKYVCFSYGYTRRNMTFEINRIHIGVGNAKWGAPMCDVFIIKLGKRIN